MADEKITDLLTLLTLPPDTPVRMGDHGLVRHAVCLSRALSRVGTLTWKFHEEGAYVAEVCYGVTECARCNQRFERVPDDRADH